jgi:hypothetical protein
MTKRKTPPNADGASPNKVSVSAKAPRMTRHKFVYHVQGIDRKGEIRKSRLFNREFAAIECAENYIHYCDGITPYIQLFALTHIPDYSNLAMPEGIYLSRRDAEISIFGYSLIPAGER